VAIQLLHLPQGDAHAGQLGGRLAVLDVVRLGEAVVGQDQFVNGQIPGHRDRRGQAAAAGLPLCDDGGVLDPALGRAVLAEEYVTARAEPVAQRHHGLATLLVKTVGGNGLVAGHADEPFLRKTSALFKGFVPRFQPLEGTVTAVRRKV
jgi:hypothetical protein